MTEEEGIVGLSVKERARLVELEQVKAGRQTLVAAAARLGISERQAKRIWKRYRKGGARGLVHLGRGRASNRSYPEAVKRESLELYRARLEGFGPTLAAEKLAEAELRVSHETLRRWLIGEGLWKRERRRGPHRRWRPRKEHFGELVQMDGSFHDWLERGDKPCLIDMVDDATSRMEGRFFEQETTEGAMRVLWRWIEQYGIPRALYTDHKNLYVTARQPTAQEQLAGEPALTSFGRACHRLGIEIIPAASPQAKGRIERRHGVLQDRLVKELRLRGIKDLGSANDLLRDEFLGSINGKFSEESASSVDFHRPVPRGCGCRTYSSSSSFAACRTTGPSAGRGGGTRSAARHVTCPGPGRKCRRGAGWTAAERSCAMASVWSSTSCPSVRGSRQPEPWPPSRRRLGAGHRRTITPGDGRSPTPTRPRNNSDSIV